MKIVFNIIYKSWTRCVPSTHLSCVSCWMSSCQCLLALRSTLYIPLMCWITFFLSIPWERDMAWVISAAILDMSLDFKSSRWKRLNKIVPKLSICGTLNNTVVLHLRAGGTAQWYSIWLASMRTWRLISSLYITYIHTHAHRYKHTQMWMYTYKKKWPQKFPKSNQKKKGLLWRIGDF